METRGKSKKARCDEIVESLTPDHNVTIHKLNDDCLTNIFMFLQIVDRVRIERVCKRWRNISKKSWQDFKTLDNNLANWGFHARIPKINRSILEKVLQRGGSFLRHLDLSSFVGIESSILHSVGKLCPNLQYLDIQSIKLTVPAIKILTKNCHELKTINFGESTVACDDILLSEFFSQNKQLQSLKINFNYSFTGKCLLSLPVDMDTIIMERCSLQSFKYVRRALKQFRQLKTFRFRRSACFLSSKGIHSLPKTMKILEISDLEFMNLNCIVEMNDLEKLTIYKEDLVTDAFLLTLAANCKKLYHLDISGCKNVTDVGVQALTSLPEIKYLTLNYLRKITGYTLTCMPKLRELSCKGCRNLKDDGLCTLLATCDFIEVLDLYDCLQITNILVECALRVAKNRTNNLVLHLILSDDDDGSVDFSEIHGDDALLKITLLSFDEVRSEDDLFWLL